MRAFPAVALAVLAAQPVIASIAPIAGYDLVRFQLSVEIFPGKVQLLNGTIEQVHDQINRINPRWKPYAAVAASERGGLEVKRSTVVCGGGWYVSKARVQNGVNLLRSWAGNITNSPGPGSCGRISCSEHSVIWWCNDNRPSFTLDIVKRVGESAQRLIDMCASGPRDLVSGQNFEDGNWNTLVRLDLDDC